MKKIILLVLFISLSKIFLAQENNFLNKTYENSKANLEFGIGYLFNPSDPDYAITRVLGFSNKNLIYQNNKNLRLNSPWYKKL